MIHGDFYHKNILRLFNCVPTISNINNSQLFQELVGSWKNIPSLHQPLSNPCILKALRPGQLIIFDIWALQTGFPMNSHHSWMILGSFLLRNRHTWPLQHRPCQRLRVPVERQSFRQTAAVEQHFGCSVQHHLGPKWDD